MRGADMEKKVNFCVLSRAPKTQWNDMNFNYILCVYACGDMGVKIVDKNLNQLEKVIFIHIARGL